MKQSQVSSLKFQVGAAAVAAVNFKLQTSNFKLSALILALGTVLIAAMLLLPVAVSAQKLVIDPTRPPVGLGAGAADTESDTAGGIRLQSVMISPTQSAAIINGVRVRLGEKYGDAVLVRVTESEVVLRSGGAQQVLKIHPGVEKREIAPVASAAAKSAPRKAEAKTQRDANPPADAGAPVRQGVRP
jgi:MSHA biogenesis protein MshK